MRGASAIDLAFEPTGVLERDYCAYCELCHVSEHSGILGGISVDVVPPEVAAELLRPPSSARGASRPTSATSPPRELTNTTLSVKNVDGILDYNAMLPLAKAIGHCPSLTAVDFRSVTFSSPALLLLINALSTAPSVQSVEVSFCPPAVEDPTPIPPSALQALTISVAPLPHLNDAAADGKERRGDRGGARTTRGPKAAAVPESAPSVVQVGRGYVGLPHLRSLAVLTLRCNSLTDEDAAPLLRNVAVSRTLRTVSLWGNKLTDASAPHIASMLRTNHSLVAMDVGNNDFTDAAVAAMLFAFVPVVATGHAFQRLRFAARRSLGCTSQPESLTQALVPLAELDAVAVDAGAASVAAKRRRAKGPAAGGERSIGLYERDCIGYKDLEGLTDAALSESQESFAIVPPNRTLRSLSLAQCSLSARSALSTVAVLLAMTPQNLSCGFVAAVAPTIAREKGEPGAAQSQPRAGADADSAKSGAAARAAAIAACTEAMTQPPTTAQLEMISPLFTAMEGFHYDPVAAAGWLRHTSPARATVALQRVIMPRSAKEPPIDGEPDDGGQSALQGALDAVAATKSRLEPLESLLV